MPLPFGFELADTGGADGIERVSIGAAARLKCFRHYNLDAT